MIVSKKKNYKEKNSKEKVNRFLIRVGGRIDFSYSKKKEGLFVLLKFIKWMYRKKIIVLRKIIGSYTKLQIYHEHP